MRAVILLAGLLLSPLSSLAQAVPAEAPLQRDIHEAVTTLPVTVRDRHGVVLSAPFTVTTFRPDGEGPFPLVILNHGRAVSAELRAQPARQRMESAARYFVRKGFAVAVPTRLGYGQSVALGDPEDAGPCDRSQWQAAVEAGMTQLAATYRYMRGQPWVSTRDWLLVGQSAGGFLVTAAAARDWPGLRLAISFAGGRGGDPERHPGVPCSPATLQQHFADWGRQARVPMLWLYTRNDQFFGPAYSSAWAKVYRDAGGQLDFQLLPAFGRDGHSLFGAGNDVWQPLLDRLLAGSPWPQPAALTSLPVRRDLDVRDSQTAPLRQTRVGRADYERFLTRPLPRAFAIDGLGRWGWATGDDAPSRALAFCQQRAAGQCRLYAVNEQVVWR